MSGVKGLRKLPVGSETTSGTAVAASTVWAGPAESIEDGRDLRFIPQDIGRLSDSTRTSTTRLGASMEMPEQVATFEQIDYVLGSALGAPIESTDGSARVREYTLPYTTVITPVTRTLECGDNQAAYEMEYSFVDGFKISGKAEDNVMLSANWVGRQKTVTTFTAGQTPPADVEELVFGKTKFYVDDTTVGATQRTNSLIAYELDVQPGTTARYAADGALTFTGVRQGKPTATLTLTMEHDTAGATESTNFANETKRLVRLHCEGATLTTAGTYFTTKALRIDACGKWEQIGKLGDDNGDDTVEGALHVVDDGTNFLRIYVANLVPVLP